VFTLASVAATDGPDAGEVIRTPRAAIGKRRAVVADDDVDVRCSRDELGMRGESRSQEEGRWGRQSNPDSLRRRMISRLTLSAANPSS
jgi:hypothetical protein